MHSRARSTSMGELGNFLKRPSENDHPGRKKPAVTGKRLQGSRGNNVEVLEPASLDPEPGPSPSMPIWECSCCVSPEPVGFELGFENQRIVLGGFLEHCNLCKKRLDTGKDIYMYKDMCAFCSPACRDKRIMFDEILEASSSKATNRATGLSSASCHLKNNNVKGRVGAQYGKSAAS